MPDISKLPELAALFDTTIDMLLGRPCPLVEKAAEGKLSEYAETASITVDELAQAAPLLPPRQIDDLTDQLMSLPNLPDMNDLLPFLSTGTVDALLRQRAAQGQRLLDYLPFASQNAVDEIARELDAQGKSIEELAPFMSTGFLGEIASRREQAGQSIDSLAPFLSSDALRKIVLARLQQGRSICDLLPFLDSSLLEQLFKAASTKD